MKRILLAAATLALSACTPPTPSGPPPPATPVFFEPWSAALDSTATKTIAAAAQTASANPNALITVTGAADSSGSAKANHYLSQTRAQIVADQLESDGIPATRIHIRALGTIPTPTAPGTPAQIARRVLIQIGG